MCRLPECQPAAAHDPAAPQLTGPASMVSLPEIPAGRGAELSFQVDPLIFSKKSFSNSGEPIPKLPDAAQASAEGHEIESSPTLPVSAPAGSGTASS